jgi:hypothetical protein
MIKHHPILEIKHASATKYVAGCLENNKELFKPLLQIFLKVFCPYLGVFFLIVA